MDNIRVTQEEARKAVPGEQFIPAYQRAILLDFIEQHPDEEDNGRFDKLRGIYAEEVRRLWKEDPEFREMVKQLDREAVTRIVDRLLKKHRGALERLSEL